jgi:hypothetical protein
MTEPITLNSAQIANAARVLNEVLPQMGVDDGVVFSQSAPSAPLVLKHVRTARSWKFNSDGSETSSES